MRTKTKSVYYCDFCSKHLKTEVGGCPVCILTVIRCNKYRWPLEIHYDFKDELRKWWDSVNSEEEEMERSQYL